MNSGAEQLGVAEATRTMQAETDNSSANFFKNTAWAGRPGTTWPAGPVQIATRERERRVTRANGHAGCRAIQSHDERRDGG